MKTLLGGTSPVSEQARLTGHLETCELCQQRLAAVGAQDAAGRALARRLGGERPDPEAGLREALRRLIGAAGEGEPEATQRDDDLSLDFLGPPTQPGQLGRIDHYAVLEVVGRGGMGIVLRAFDEQLHRVVAVKVMAAQLAASTTARKRFAREARAAAAIRDERVIGIHAVEERNTRPYLVMEYVQGVSLQQRLDRGGPLEVESVVRIGLQVALGLAAAHAQGLVHRDVKPANILLENGVERIKLTDFGLARAVDDAGLTQFGVLTGTPEYMAPEQARGEPADHRADLFSLGSVLYAMCAGHPPFRASGSMAILKRVCEEAPRPVREARRETPEWLAALIARLHAKEPAGRFQSAAEVAGVLGQHLAHLQHPSVVGPVANSPEDSGARPSARSRWRPRAIAAAVLLCFVGTLGLAEATGVTRIVPTVIRVFTPDGTLVVEVDDPGVKVTIEGDAGIVITGAGLEEIRLRPGSYKVQADRDGKPVPLEREQVSIARGGREVVRVKLEAPATKPLSQEEKLEHARLQLEEADRLYKLGEPLRGPDPWQAELHFRRAVAIYETLRQEIPESPASRQKLEACRWGLGSALHMQANHLVVKGPAATPAEAQRAVALAREAVALAPTDDGFWIGLGLAQGCGGDWKAARDALEKAEQLPTRSAPAYHDIRTKFSLASAYWHLGDKAKARERYQQAADLMDKYERPDIGLLGIQAETGKRLGMLPQTGGNGPETLPAKPLDDPKLVAELAAYDVALKTDADDLGTVLKRGEVLQRLKRYDAAFDAFSQVIARTSDTAQRASSLINRGHIHVERGNVQDVIDDYEESVRIRPLGEAWIYGRIANCYLFGPEKLRDSRRALEYAAIAIQKRGAHAGFHTVRGVCLYRVGRHADAIEVLERAYQDERKQDGQTAMNRFFAAMAYQRLEEPAKAQECYAVARKLTQPSGHPGMFPNWIEQMRSEAEAVLKIRGKK